MVSFENKMPTYIHGMKELGEICEVLIRKNRPEHWKNELGDLCALFVKPMLDLADLSFEDAIEIGLKRKKEKMEKK